MIVITGASDGLGLELAKLYDSFGKHVVNISRRKSTHAKTNILANLREGSEIERAAAVVAAIDEPLEALINCAGVLSIQPLGEITEDEIKRVMSTNLKSAILLVSALAERVQKDGADIVNVASTVGTKAYKDQAVYGASKWAMRGFSANLQLEFKDTPTRVISFCVGGFNSKIAEKVTGEPIEMPEDWMDPADVALSLKQMLDLPKNMEISEVIINRKRARKA